MQGLISYISLWALGFIKSAGYTGIFILSALESAAVPIPSEVVVPFSGFLAASSALNFWLIVVVSTVANVVGSFALYWIGKSGGRWFVERYGKYILISKSDVARSDVWFGKYGSAAVFFGRMIPVVRTFISLPAGIAKMSTKRFIIFTTLGALPWNYFLALFGYKIGKNWDILGGYFRKLDLVVIISAAVFIVWHILKHKKHE